MDDRRDRIGSGSSVANVRACNMRINSPSKTRAMVGALADSASTVAYQLMMDLGMSSPLHP